MFGLLPIQGKAKIEGFEFNYQLHPVRAKLVITRLQLASGNSAQDLAQIDHATI
jgi:hypothetical protein